MGQHAFKMQTYLADQRSYPRRVQQIIERSRQNYGSRLPVVAVDAGGSRLPG
jgi:hypothetical protein